jgi:hypothetical protein
MMLPEGLNDAHHTNGRFRVYIRDRAALSIMRVCHRIKPRMIELASEPILERDALSGIKNLC